MFKLIMRVFLDFTSYSFFSGDSPNSWEPPGILRLLLRIRVFAYLLGLLTIWAGYIYILSKRLGHPLAHQWAFTTIGITFGIIAILAFSAAVIRAKTSPENKHDSLRELYLHAPDTFMLLATLLWMGTF